ncbi:peptide/nickel transport system substrate-binding protein [Sulfurivirga caldicuralii]|uniref:Peptide/nickel transport system substrate-binding protein n=1 Tax=Sulfurivirga caldicuralii TaxID=364032 RepID=A0A1N6F0P5_9GAMM|nr:ABC transporter substrate-binding protein [Sulfurivirga caldicuralii]SIN88809.1 peptide/nickel transport system substrate-binding protein [Sulfurivirga caldicuralii]
MNAPFPRRTLLAAGCGLPLLGCSARTPLPQNHFRLGVSGRPRSLDPRRATDALSSRLNRLLYEAPVDFNARFEPVPALMDWQQTAPLRWVFALRKSTRFHDGTPLTAEDVAATYASVLDPATASPHRGGLKHVQRVRALDGQRVQFDLTHVDALFPGRLTIGVLPRRLMKAGHDFNRQPLGSGPCRFVDANEQRTRLQRPDGALLEFIKVKDPLVQVLKLRKGELDWIQGGLSPELVRYCAARPELAVQWHRGTNFAYIGFNFRDSWLSQQPIREAIALGIDRAAIVQALFDNHARLAGALLPPEHWAGLKNWSGYPYDPGRARALLESAIGQGQRLSLSYKTSANPLRLRLAAIYQSMLREIGIDLTIQSYDWGTFYADIKAGRFQLYSLAWVGIKSPDIFQYVFHSQAVPPAGANRGHYANPEVDRLIEAALAAQMFAEQQRLYGQLQRVLAETVAQVPLWYEDQYAVLHRSVSGYTLAADGRYDGVLTMRRVQHG